jgi:hypothetical protein
MPSNNVVARYWSNHQIYTFSDIPTYTDQYISFHASNTPTACLRGSGLNDSLQVGRVFT